jgi:aspartyl-tRNA(Asn)/glutamyl-tRNA(Gln) amidotransferase subunit A
VFDVAAMPTTWNSRLPRPAVASADAEAVGRWRASGAVMLGKLAAWECGVGGASFALPWPPTRNPWALDRDPGGSSTGSAVAVAAGMCFGAVGSDTGGSVREPASWCGVVGLKPTLGLVSGAGGLAASFNFDHVGPLARSSEDCAHLLDAMAPGTAAADTLSRGVQGLRIGVVDLASEERLELDRDVAGAIEAATEALAGAGARLARVRLPRLEIFNAIVAVAAAAEGYAVHRRLLATSSRLYDPLTRRRLLAGARVQASDYIDALAMRQKLTQTIAKIFLEYDLLLMPTTRTAAPTLGDFDSHGGHPSLCRPWNVTGYPALSAPCGFSRDGLPLAVQLIARPNEDAVALRAGHALEARLGPSARPPDPDPNTLFHPSFRPEPDEQAATDRLAQITEQAAALLRGATAFQ